MVCVGMGLGRDIRRHSFLLWLSGGRFRHYPDARSFFATRLPAGASLVTQPRDEHGCHSPDCWVSSIHWLARPHLVPGSLHFSSSYAIESAQSGRSRYLYLLPALMMLWVNLHGGFIAGLLILGCYSLGDAASSLLDTQNGSPNLQMRVRLLSRLASFRPLLEESLPMCGGHPSQSLRVASAPAHFAYLTDTDLIDKIQEFQSISFHAGPAILFEIFLLLAAFVIFEKFQKRLFAPVLLLCFWAHYALLSARHIPAVHVYSSAFCGRTADQCSSSCERIPALRCIAGTVPGFRTIEFA